MKETCRHSVIFHKLKEWRKLVDFQRVGFDYRKACKRLAEVWTVGLTTVKHVGDLKKFGESVFTTANVWRVCFVFRNACMRLQGDRTVRFVFYKAYRRLVDALWSQNRHTELVEVSHTIWGSQNGLSKLLQASYALYEIQNSPNFHKLPTRFAEVQAPYLIFYKPPTCFAIVKSDSPNFFKPPRCLVKVKTAHTKLLQVYKRSTSFEVVITNSLKLYKLHTRIAVVKTESTNFYNPPTSFEVA